MLRYPRGHFAQTAAQHLRDLKHGKGFACNSNKALAGGFGRRHGTQMQIRYVARIDQKIRPNRVGAMAGTVPSTGCV